MGSSSLTKSFTKWCISGIMPLAPMPQWSQSIMHINTRKPRSAAQNLPVVQALNAPWRCVRGVSQRSLRCIAFPATSIDLVVLRGTKNVLPHLPIPHRLRQQSRTPKGCTALLFLFLSAACHRASSWRMVGQRPKCHASRCTPGRCNIQVAASPSIRH